MCLAPAAILVADCLVARMQCKASAGSYSYHVLINASGMLIRPGSICMGLRSAQPAAHAASYTPSDLPVLYVLHQEAAHGNAELTTAPAQPLCGKLPSSCADGCCSVQT